MVGVPFAVVVRMLSLHKFAGRYHGIYKTEKQKRKLAIMNQENRTQTQKEVVSRLVTTFGIDGSRILFLNPNDPNDPWIPASQLEIIARQMEGYQNSIVRHDKFIAQTAQVIYLATVIDKGGLEFTRSGAATLGEVPPGMEDYDADKLAAGRALSAALTAAGFHPCKVDFRRETVSQNQQNHKQFQINDEADLRLKDLRQIHALAEEKGLWIGRDDSRYREKLFENFGVKTSAILNRTERAAVINWLQNYRINDFLNDVPASYREEALIA